MDSKFLAKEPIKQLQLALWHSLLSSSPELQLYTSAVQFDAKDAGGFRLPWSALGYLPRERKMILLRPKNNNTRPRWRADELLQIFPPLS